MLLAQVMLLCLFGIFLLAALLAGQLNRGIYRLAYGPRPIDPWSSPHQNAPPRRWYDRIPVVGWWFLRRESEIHGAGFWVRPMAIEATVAVGFAALYWVEVNGYLLPAAFQSPQQVAALSHVLHAQFLAHVVMISLMIMATFIDFDEQTIPDAITVPGTLLALGLSAWLPWSHPLIGVPAGRGLQELDFLHVASPYPWPVWLESSRGLALGVGLLICWCLAILDWRWITRRGLTKAFQYLGASILRRHNWKLLPISVLGSIAVAVVWAIGGAAWRGLFTSLAGVALGGGIVWAIRVIGSHAMRREAMGFGDVTLMAMLGGFLGWQPASLVFFLAPFTAVFIAVAQLLLTRRTELAFGPYLCLAALILALGWGVIWPEWAADVFILGWWLPAGFAVLLALMYVMLLAMRVLRELAFGSED